MPDRNIIYRTHYEDDGPADWRRMFRRLGEERRQQRLQRLDELDAAPRERPQLLSRLERPLGAIVQHYYPRAQTAPRIPADDM